MPTLTIQLPNLPPVDHILRDEMMTIGRMKGNTIALDDASVSVSHAKITRKGAEFFLKDLNSTNGTMLNGQSINEARLKDGDQVKFGEVIAIYRSEPEFISTTVGAVPVAVATPSPQPAVVPAPPPPTMPAPAALPAATATTFVSKRLVVQAAAPSASAPSLPAGPQTVRTQRPQKKNAALPMPLIVGAVVVLTLISGWAIFLRGGNPTSRVAPRTDTPLPEAAAKNPAPNGAAGNAAVRPGDRANNNPAPATVVLSLVELKRALKANDPAERRKAAAKLREMGACAKDALPELRAALNDTDADVRMWSALALINNKSYDKAAIPILIQVLQNENSMLRQISCLSLALIPYEDADRDKVVAALSDSANKDDDEDVRKAAVSALKIIAPDAAAAK